MVSQFKCLWLFLDIPIQTLYYRQSRPSQYHAMVMRHKYFQQNGYQRRFETRNGSLSALPV